ncbi:MAG TPA: hypothetical protein VFQ55_00480 [Casimicrobiaceae bacterium]|nr:hypothetical protein [Casimicrobiaceae bacterium]
MGNGVGAPLGYPASEAVHLLLHHVHGGLHNAAMALQLAIDDNAGGAGDEPALVAQSGLEGIARAARGVSLLTVALGLKAGPGATPADHQWVALVESLLRERARQRQVELDLDGDDGAPGAPDPDGLVERLVRGIEAIDRAAPRSRLALSRGATSPSGTG